jgi:hypothetical protein
MKQRVHEVAKQLGVPVEEVLVRLSELGEFVKSASSTLEEPVTRRLYQLYGVSGRPQTLSAEPKDSARADSDVADNPYTPKIPLRPHREGLPEPFSMRSTASRRPGGPQVANDPFGVESRARVQRGPVRPRKPRREWHQGADPSELQKVVLRAGILPRRELLVWPANIPDGRYFVDEVDEARDFEARWREAILFLTLPEIEDWVRLVSGASVREALKFHEAGMTARDASLRLWYGRLNAERPTLFDQVTQGSLAIADAARHVRQYRSKVVGQEVGQVNE